MARQRSSVCGREQSHCVWRRRGSARTKTPQQSGATARSAACSRVSWYLPPMLAQSRTRSLPAPAPAPTPAKAAAAKAAAITQIRIVRWAFKLELPNCILVGKRDSGSG